MDVGMCYQCKRYREYGEGRCAKCDTPFTWRREVERELEREFYALLLPLQDYHDTEPMVARYTNPLWILNKATNPMLREAVAILQGVAARHGIVSPEVASGAGKNIEIMIGDTKWAAWEDAGGSITKIRVVTPETGALETSSQATTLARNPEPATAARGSRKGKRR